MQPGCHARGKVLDEAPGMTVGNTLGKACPKGMPHARPVNVPGTFPGHIAPGCSPTPVSLRRLGDWLWLRPRGHSTFEIFIPNFFFLTSTFRTYCHWDWRGFLRPGTWAGIVGSGNNGDECRGRMCPERSGHGHAPRPAGMPSAADDLAAWGVRLESPEPRPLGDGTHVPC